MGKGGFETGLISGKDRVFAGKEGSRLAIGALSDAGSVSLSTGFGKGKADVGELVAAVG